MDNFISVQVPYTDFRMSDPYGLFNFNYIFFSEITKFNIYTRKAIIKKNK